jgi:hypothetical protein
MSGHIYIVIVVVFFVQLVLQTDAGIAPDDYSRQCRTDFQYRRAHDWIPYANDTSSGTWKVLIDQYDYQSILGVGGGAVWKAIDADTGTPDRITVRFRLPFANNILIHVFNFSLPKAVVEHAPIKLK